MNDQYSRCRFCGQQMTPEHACNIRYGGEADRRIAELESELAALKEWQRARYLYESKLEAEIAKFRRVP